MNLNTLFDRITSKQKQRHDARVADNRSLVAQIADDQEPDPAQIDELLAANGKPIDDLKADVELHNQRRTWREQSDAVPALAKEKAAIQRQIAEADKALQAAEEQHDQVTGPLYYRLGAIKEATRLGNHARIELHRTCSDPALLDELDRVRSEHRAAHDRLMQMSLEIRRCREEADADSLDKRRQQREAKLPEAEQTVATLANRETEILERMLVV